MQKSFSKLQMELSSQSDQADIDATLMESPPSDKEGRRAFGCHLIISLLCFFLFFSFSFDRW